MIDLDNLQAKCERTVDFAAGQLRNLVEAHPDHFPMYTQNGKWMHSGEAWTNWCEGFLGGQLWLVYQATGDEYFREKAEHYSRLLEHRKTDLNVHDLGFLFFSTWKRWYDITGEEDKNAVVVEAGQTLAKRFKEKGEYLRSFVSDESLFIDIMMNVPIIFYAAQETDDEELWETAYRHCLTTRRYLVRGDGSTSHEGIFDLETGEFLRQTTHQGWRDDSSWARGLGWSLYGFGTVYGLTGDARFLKTSQDNAWFYMENTPDHGVPPNDWMEAQPQNPHESSAAAIAASGLIQLSQLVGDPTLGKQYNDYALQIVDTLTEPEFVAFDDEDWEGVLKQGMYHERLGLGVNESVMWGDYFFLEAVCKVLGVE
ncbi:MAG: glycoside hydrolase family 88 protein [Caldilineaceae bacterium]|nr:glycoside hydrolase family 88 protein [Caldilineaceae bacterium]MDE0336153.1 glycoside hydrolase family 88 protein [Caldilineaceae bacterium]